MEYLAISLITSHKQEGVHTDMSVADPEGKAVLLLGKERPI